MLLESCEITLFTERQKNKKVQQITKLTEILKHVSEVYLMCGRWNSLVVVSATASCCLHSFCWSLFHHQWEHQQHQQQQQRAGLGLGWRTRPSVGLTPRHQSRRDRPPRHVSSRNSWEKAGGWWPSCYIQHTTNHPIFNTTRYKNTQLVVVNILQQLTKQNWSLQVYVATFSMCNRWTTIANINFWGSMKGSMYNHSLYFLRLVQKFQKGTYRVTVMVRVRFSLVLVTTGWAKLNGPLILFKLTKY